MGHIDNEGEILKHLKVMDMSEGRKSYCCCSKL